MGGGFRPPISVYLDIVVIGKNRLGSGKCGIFANPVCVYVCCVLNFFPKVFFLFCGYFFLFRGGEGQHGGPNQGDY